MKLLVATKETQGYRKNDFCWCKEGELVRFSFECDDDGIDGKCGCKRSMSGFKTHKATTTMKVIDIKITNKELLEKVRKTNKESGWYEAYGKDAEKYIKKETEELRNVCKRLPVGTIIEKRGDILQSRRAK